MSRMNAVSMTNIWLQLFNPGMELSILLEQRVGRDRPIHVFRLTMREWCGGSGHPRTGHGKATVNCVVVPQLSSAISLTAVATPEDLMSPTVAT